MNVIKEIERINKAELANGSVNTPASWHAKYADSAWVYIGNLPTQLSEGDILAVMSQWGEVEDINLVREDSGRGKSRGFCFLKYEDSRSCVLAVDNFNGTKILGRSIRVDHVENYRLPKHLREGEEGEKKEEDLAAYQGESAHESKNANSFDINQGQDLFAAVPPSTTESSKIENVEHAVMNKTERKEAKNKRKEQRDKQRRDKEARREDREERRRVKRAKRQAHESKKRMKVERNDTRR